MEPARVVPTKIGIGVDFGMTYSGSAVFYLMGGNFPHLEPVPIIGSSGRTKFPTRVFVPTQGNAYRVGYRANVDSDGKLYSLFKRHLGTQWTDTVGQKQITASFLTMIVLKKIKEDIDQFLLDHGFDEAGIAKEYTFSYPGTWQPVKIDALKQAIQGAGFPDINMIDEPTASALAVPKSGGFPEVLVGSHHILVCDLGGGTLDLADVTTTPTGMINMQAAVSGDGLIGMSNLDKIIGLKACAKRDLLLSDQLAVADANIVYGPDLERAWQSLSVADAFKNQLLAVCESAKMTACQDWEALDTFPMAMPDRNFVVLDKHGDLQPIFDAMNAAVQQTARRYLADLDTNYGIRATDIRYVVIGGGGSALPNIGATLGTLVPKAKILALTPEIGTSLVQRGAAVHAHSPRMIRTRRVNTTYGVKGYEKAVPAYPCSDTRTVKRGLTRTTYYAHYTKYLKRGDEVHDVDHIFTPLEENQPSIVFKILSGDDENPANNRLVGEVTLPLEPHTPVDYEVHCVFRLGKDGLISVTGEDRNHKKTSPEFKLTLDLDPDAY